MAAHAHSSTVSQLALNISSQEVQSRKSSRVAATSRSFPSGYAQGSSSRGRVHLRICRFSQGLKNDSKLGYCLVSRSGHRKFNGSRGTRKMGARCAKGGSDDSLGGDPQVQQMLVEMVQIQIGKSRMSDFVDERSQHMRNIAKDTFDQYDRIAYRTMKGLDATGSRVSTSLTDLEKCLCSPKTPLGTLFRSSVPRALISERKSRSFQDLLSLEWSKDKRSWKLLDSCSEINVQDTFERHKVLRQLDADAQAIERELRLARAELEAQELDFEEYQQVVAYSRNEGLFFKNLYPAPKPLRFKSAALAKASVKENVAIVRPTQDFSSSYRQVLYGGLSLVIVSFIWSSSSALLAGTWMRASKLAAYGIIFSALLTQLAYVKVLVGEEDLDEEEGPIDVTNNED